MLSFFFDLVFSTQLNRVVFLSHLCAVECKISRSSGGFAPWTPTMDSLGIIQPPDPQLQKAMTLGHCLSCLWQDKTQLKNSLQLPKGHKTASVLICSLQNVFGQFTKPGHFFESTRCTIGSPLKVFTYLPENIWGATGCVTEGCFLRPRVTSVNPSS